MCILVVVTCKYFFYSSSPPSLLSSLSPSQVLLLVAGRWLVGWVFPAKDLEILDDPIPEKLYCGRRCTPHKMASSNDSGASDSADPEKGLEISEDLDSKYLDESRRDAKKPSMDGSLNMTQEVNNCDLWRHMVGSMDKQPSSSSLKRTNSAKANLLNKFDEVEMGGASNQGDVGGASNQGDVGGASDRVELVGHQPLFKSTEV